MSYAITPSSSIPIPEFHLSPSLDWQSESVQLRNQRYVVQRFRITLSPQCPTVYEIMDRLDESGPASAPSFPERDPTAVGSTREEIVGERTGAIAGDPDELGEALHDLHSSIEEAQQEEFYAPSAIAMENAEQFIRNLYALSSRRLEVYPTPDGEIAVVAPFPGKSVMVLCDSDGGGLLMAHMAEGHWRARYADAREIPSFLLQRAIEDMDAAE